MSRTKHTRKQPLHKRYPQSYTVRAVVHTPEGTRLEANGPIANEDVASLLVSLLAMSLVGVPANLAAKLRALRADIEAASKKR